jgi:ribosomal protein S18 acetylase RimI-like enzyme
MIKIQKAKKEDARGIQDVFYEAWLVTYPNEEIGIIKEDVEERFKNRHSDEQILRRINQIEHVPENEQILVAKDGDVVVGVCKLEIKEAHNDLGAIYVLPEYHRKGIGTMFWKKALEFFDKEKDIVVNVDEFNKRAISFYKKLGFVDTGKRFTEEHFRMPISGVSIQEMQMIIKRNVCGKVIEKNNHQ